MELRRQVAAARSRQGWPRQLQRCNPRSTPTSRMGASVTAANVRVQAELASASESTVPSDSITNVDTVNDTLQFAFPVSTGDVVEYESPSGQTAIGGLTPRPATSSNESARQYNVLRLPGVH